jgi:hypothetical protein
MWANHKRTSGAFKQLYPFYFKVQTTPATLPWYLSEVELKHLRNERELSTLKDLIDKLKIAPNRVPTSTWNETCRSFVLDIDGLVADVPDSIDYASMGRFIEACERMPRVLFFNVQVSFDDWFRPELQTHLALQDATTTKWQLDAVVDKESESYATKPCKTLPHYYGTPTARVLFVTYTKDELIKKLRKGDREVQNFIDLTLIHLFMSTPLAIVTVDQLLAILKSPPPKEDDINFAETKISYSKVLNLPTPEELTYGEERSITILKGKLDQMIMRPGAENDAGIDFALLMKNRGANRRQAHEVWTGSLNRLNDMEYHKVDDKAKLPIYYRFGKRIEHTVFRPLEEADVEKSSALVSLLKGNPDEPHAVNIRACRLLAKRLPCFKVFHKAHQNPRLRYKFARAMKFVWPEYCPLHIINDSGGRWGSVFSLSEE